MVEENTQEFVNLDPEAN